MDYESEQQMEIEALEAIFMDDLQIYNGTLPDGWNATGNSYKMVIDPTEEGEEPAENHEEMIMELIWAHTPNYPDEAPNYKVRAVRGLSDADIAQASGVMQEQIDQNIGMAMIYTLVTAAKEWLRRKWSSAHPWQMYMPCTWHEHNVHIMCMHGRLTAH